MTHRVITAAAVAAGLLVAGCGSATSTTSGGKAASVPAPGPSSTATGATASTPSGATTAASSQATALTPALRTIRAFCVGGTAPTEASFAQAVDSLVAAKGSAGLRIGQYSLATVVKAEETRLGQCAAGSKARNQTAQAAAARLHAAFLPAPKK